MAMRIPAIKLAKLLRNGLNLGGAGVAPAALLVAQGPEGRKGRPPSELGVGLEHQGRGGAVDQVVIQLGGAHLDGPLLGIDLAQVELAPVGAVQEEPVAETCVFGKQLPGPFHCDQLALAPLLPKLRGHFAEFLREGSLAPLGILYPPTCVGFGYG